jgi:peptidoglycan/xylan/chitin deacetylase (PgdA/CDA1 family)
MAALSGAVPVYLPRVLTYHAISEDRDDPYAVTPSLFERHLDLLSQLNLHGVSLRDLMEGTFSEDRGRIALTLDDATGCQFARAIPALAERGFGATVFVPSAIVSGASRPVARSHMCWEQVVELASIPGMEIGSHSRTHASLGGLRPAQAIHEIATSKEEIENRIGVAVDSFAYPYGRRTAFNAFTRGAVKEAGYRWACTMVAGSIRKGCDLLELPRNGVLCVDSPRRLRWKVLGRYDRIQDFWGKKSERKDSKFACVE